MSLYSKIAPPITELEKQMLKQLLDGNLSFDNKSAREVIKRVSEKTGLSADFIAASALQEGMNKAIKNPENVSAAYINAKVGNDYPVDGFYNYGLDTFGDAAKKLQAKGYIPADFNYKQYNAYNEKGEIVSTAAFKNNEDALTAKAAYLKDFMDNVKEEAAKRKLNLTERQLKYFTMVGYNGGMGSVKDMLDEVGDNVDVYIENGGKKRTLVHKNVKPRIEKMDYLSEIFNSKN